MNAIWKGFLIGTFTLFLVTYYFNEWSDSGTPVSKGSSIVVGTLSVDGPSGEPLTDREQTFLAVLIYKRFAGESAEAWRRLLKIPPTQEFTQEEFLKLVPEYFQTTPFEVNYLILEGENNSWNESK